MGLTGCGKFLKYSMFMFNVVILVAGCGILGFGVYTRTSENRLNQLTAILGSTLYSTLSMAFIVVGGVVIVLSFFGCCGAIKEVKCMLGTFFVLLLVMLLGMIIGGVVAYMYRDQIGEVILDHLYISLNTSYGFKTDVTDAWDKMQSLFDCCGVVGDFNSTTSWAFYRNTPWFLNKTNMKQFVPETCCRNAMGVNRTKCLGIGSEFETIIPAMTPPVYEYQLNEFLYTDGCYTAIIDFLNDNVQIVAGLAAGVSVLMVLGMVFAICLCRRIKDEFLFD